MPSKYITILAGHFEQPLADLVATLSACKRDTEFPSIPTSREIDYSIVSTVLLVMMFESYVSRIRYFDKSSKNRRDVLSYLALIPGFHAQHRRLLEVYILRDAIAHNHVLEFEQKWKEDSAPYNTNFQLDRSWQAWTKKYGQRVKLRKRKPPITKLLKLNVMPTQICKDDVRVVFREIHESLKRLDKLGKLDLSIENLHVRYISKKNGQEVKHLSFPFWNLIDEI